MDPDQLACYEYEYLCYDMFICVSCISSTAIHEPVV